MRQPSRPSALRLIWGLVALSTIAACAQTAAPDSLTSAPAAASTSIFPPAGQPADPLAALIQARLAPLVAALPALAPGSEPSLTQRIDLNRAEVDFYSRRNFRSAWTSDADVTQLLDSLRRTEADGLNPRDYHVDELATLQTSLQQPASTPAQRADFDIAATHAYLAALLQLRRGKVDPARLEMQWNFDPASIDPQKDLQEILDAVDQHQVAHAFDRAPPQGSIYGRLRSALARLRAIESSGGWPLIDAGPKLAPGVTDPRVSALRERLVAGGYLAPAPPTDPAFDAIFDPAVEAAVRQFQGEQYLPVDGAVGAATLAAFNVPVAARIDQVRVNLERARWLLHKLQGTFVVVDIAGYKIALYRDGQAVWRSRVQVGKPFRSTPVFQSQITTITFNPTWTVPPTILKNDILPKIRSDPTYLASHQIRVIDGHGDIVPPSSVDWRKPRGVTLRQDAGPDNSLGQVVIRFPNAYAVYLHDTPHRDLFAQDRRATSSGCIRVERPLELVERLFNDPVRWNAAGIQAQLATGKTQNVSLPVKVPLLLAYWTVDIGNDGRVSFKPDVYGHDAALLSALDAPAAY